MSQLGEGWNASAEVAETRTDDATSADAVAYIARQVPGLKADLEGGHVPLVGFGTLAEITDQADLERRFEHACQPWHDRRGTTGYKSFTFTLPKEVSLFAEGHRQTAKSSMYAAIRCALDRAFVGMDITALAAIHTRNDAGEVHYHAHVLVAKFARNRATNRVVSLNSKAGGNTGARIHQLKRGWKETIDRELERHLRVQVEQPGAFARPAHALPDGSRVAPLNRDSRRHLDRYLSPVFTETTSSGQAVRKVLRINDAMDGRIFEVASANGGAGWSAKGFLEIAPDQARHLGRYEKRVLTLKRVGYLSAEGKITPAFRLHYCARHGADTPELQRIRFELARSAAKESRRTKRPVVVPELWEAVDRYESIRKRIERLGISRDDLRRMHEEAKRRRPTPENLRQIRKDAERRALRDLKTAAQARPRTKTLIRAFVDLQKARVRTAFLVSAGIVQLKYGQNKRIAEALMRAARADMFYAKERRLDQVARCFRPMFWATRLVMPQSTRRLELAIARCAGLAATQDAVRRAYNRYIGQRHAQIIEQARKFERPEQRKKLPELERARARIPGADVEASARQLKRGLDALRQIRPDQAQVLFPWAGRSRELVERVVAKASGDHGTLPDEQYQVAFRAGRMGRLLEREQAQSATSLPSALAAHAWDLQKVAARLKALDIANPFTPELLRALPRKEIVQQLEQLRATGLLDDGPAWTVKTTAIKDAIAHPGRAIASCKRRDDVER